MFIFFEKVSETNEKIIIDINYNGDEFGKAIYNFEEASFTYENEIDKKMKAWKPLEILENRMMKIIKDKDPVAIYAIG